jgi:poly-beta-1,6-N-acetyl-D-glucosamine synthase
MNSLLIIVVFIIIFLIFYNYFLYPVIIFLISLIKKPREFKKAESHFGGVSILVAAHNEEAVIESKLKNFLKIKYPKDKLEIIFGLDNCSDNTLGIIQSYANKDKRIKYFDFKKRQGKPNVINKIKNSAKFDLLVMTDANTIFEKDAIYELVKHFTEDRVGLVVGNLELAKLEGGSGENLYWRYENFIKRSEANLGIVSSINGGIYMIRKDLLPKFNEEDVADDFIALMNVISAGLEVRYDKLAIAFEDEELGYEREFNRRKRIAKGNWFLFRKYSYLFNPLNSKNSFSLFSHKLLRWLSPVLILTLFILTLLGLIYYQSIIYLLILVGFFTFFILSAFGFIFRKSDFFLFKIFKAFYYFSMMNVGLFLGFIDFLKNKKGLVWSK